MIKPTCGNHSKISTDIRKAGKIKSNLTQTREEKNLIAVEEQVTCSKLESSNRRTNKNKNNKDVSEETFCRKCVYQESLTQLISTDPKLQIKKSCMKGQKELAVFHAKDNRLRTHMDAQGKIIRSSDLLARIKNTGNVSIGKS